MRAGEVPESAGTEALPDLAQVKGQETPMRALEVAAAGGQPILLTGPAGAGKTLLARCLPGLLPPLTEAEAGAIAEGYRRAGLDPPSGCPFRAPPSTLRPSELVGRRRPGEVALAAGGVLLLDDLPAFGRRSLRALREVLDGRANARPGQGAGGDPGRFLLVATMRTCPCGASGDDLHPCDCPRWRVDHYTAPVRELFLDLVHRHIEAPPITTAELACWGSKSSREVAARVQAARCRQQARNRDGTLNARLHSVAVPRFCQPDRSARDLLDTAFGRLSLACRDREIILHVARAIADLAGSEAVRAPHMAEAIPYWTSSQRLWPPCGTVARQ